jgi:hypothetical protein
MRRCRVYVERYGWTVWAYFAKSTYYADEIMENLMRIGVRGEDAHTAYLNMTNKAVDTGLTYSNYAMRESVMVVGMASDAMEFLNSFVHELGHLTSQICEALGIDHMGEEKQYLAGGMAMRMYGAVKDMLCGYYHCVTDDFCVWGSG